jgi:uncharacterized protein YbaP (TraB family)
MKRFGALFWCGLIAAGTVFAQSSVWEIRKNGTVLYLGGSVHVLRAEDYPMPEEFDRAYENSTLLVLETDIDQAADPALMQSMAARMLLPGKETLRTLLSTEVFWLLERRCETFGLPVNQLLKIKPSMVTNMLTMMQLQQLGYVQPGADMHYLIRAKDDERELSFLESIEFQMDMLFNMGVGYEDEYMRYSLEDMESTETELPLLIDEWKTGAAGDTEAILAEMKEQFPRVYQQIATDRNNAWIPRIEAYLNTEAVEFIIVGLAHLHGPEGLLRQIREAGAQVRQLNTPR